MSILPNPSFQYLQEMLGKWDREVPASEQATTLLILLQGIIAKQKWLQNQLENHAQSHLEDTENSSAPTTGPVTEQSESSMDQLPTVQTENLEGTLESFLREGISGFFKKTPVGLADLDFEWMTSSFLQITLQLDMPSTSETEEASEETLSNGAAPSQTGRWRLDSWPYRDGSILPETHYGATDGSYHISFGDIDKEMAEQHIEAMNGNL